MIDSLPHRRGAAIAQSARLVARVGLLLTFAFASCKPMWGATLRELGVTRTPVLVVWNDRHSVLLATSVSTDRRPLRHQLIAARLLLTLE